MQARRFGPVIQRHISDGLELKRHTLLEDYPEGAEDSDENLADNIFWVPADARWSHLQANAKQPIIGRLIDEAMIASKQANPSLNGVLPKDYGPSAVNAVMLGALIDLISDSALGEGKDKNKDKARDLLVRVDAYFLGKFASSQVRRASAGRVLHAPLSRMHHV